MGKEIERKFLVLNNSWQSLADPVPIKQGYLAKQNGVTARVRTKGDKGFLTIKGPTSGLTREEFEYEIPFVDAIALLELSATPIIVKNRYHIPKGKHIWEVDEFLEDNLGLIVAEIELEAEDEFFELPSWVGEEVSNERRYFNSKLAAHPYKFWSE